jgi:hypothetical protein
MTEALSKRPLTQLNFDIEQAEAEATRLESERRVVAKQARRARQQLRLLLLARFTRKPAASFEMWPKLLLVLGSGIAGVFSFIIVHLIFNSFAIAFLGLLFGAAAGAALIASLLYRPTDHLLQTALAAAETNVKLVDARLKEKIERIIETRQRLQRLVDERRDQIASGKLQKAALLQRNWKSMQGTEWQDFVVEVCRTLGATVERLGSPGGQDADLIAEFGPRRVAVLTQGEGHNVSSDTIRHAIAAKERHQADSCAVIINRRFTGAAQDFAQRNGCTAIGTGEFPDFVMGKVEL